jgi:hypothetical protein
MELTSVQIEAHQQPCERPIISSGSTCRIHMDSTDCSVGRARVANHSSTKHTGAIRPIYSIIKWLLCYTRVCFVMSALQP